MLVSTTHSDLRNFKRFLVEKRMNKLKLQSPDLTTQNIKKLKVIFPNCISEATNDQGELIQAIDFDLLKQELSKNLVEGPQERYHLDWPGKREALLTANAPIAKTLRPAREESVNFDNTKNLFIEGDNLDALKLLQETYLNKIKMIYIDPPYNTGNDFIYKDDFAEDSQSYLVKSNQQSESGEKLVANTESNGRFHSDWLSMIYPRLKLARNLLRDDGVIFISIDDNEQANLKRVCDEVFGEENFVAVLPTIMNLKGNNDQFGFSGTHEYLLVYSKSLSFLKNINGLNGLPLEKEDLSEYNLKDHLGYYRQGATLMRTGTDGARQFRPKGYYPIYVSQTLDRMSLIKLQDDDFKIFPKTATGQEMSWRRSPETLENSLNEFIIRRSKSGISFYKKQRLEEDLKLGKKPKSLFYKPDYSSGNGTSQIKTILGDRFFPSPKPIILIKDIVKIGLNSGIVLDFFAGSSTTAHAVMQLNAQDGGTRQCISVQLPEVTDKKSEAYKAGYKTIAEISKERIRRAGQKIKQENPDSNVDIGFRVLKVDSSNMVDTYYSADVTQQKDLLENVNNIKGDRNSEDLLFQVLLSWGVDLTLPIRKITIAGKDVYCVDDNALLACFEENIDDEWVKNLANRHPLRVVFKDTGFANDAAKINVGEVFKLLSPETEVKSI